MNFILVTYWFSGLNWASDWLRSLAIQHQFENPLLSGEGRLEILKSEENTPNDLYLSILFTLILHSFDAPLPDESKILKIF